MAASRNPFGAEASLDSKEGKVTVYRLQQLAEDGVAKIDRLPYSIKVLLEAVLRNVDGYQVAEDDVTRLANWNAKAPVEEELPFKPGRVILQDFTGVPSVVDLASLRDAMKRLGGDPAKINPQVPCDLVIDHSVQVDAFASIDALTINVQKEFDRNRERYELLKWGQRAFENFRVVPPSTGIVHQVNLEYLAQVVLTKDENGKKVAFPDSLVGTDSHTTMINGLGVVGWGVGGIEAEAVMLGQPIYMLTPKVTGFKLTGRLAEGATATDLVLTVTQILRKLGVVGQFVEYYGEGLESLSLADRATIANMSPEYGATMGFFPVDSVTLDYLRMSGRDDARIDLVERYCKEQGLWRDASIEPEFTQSIELDLSTVEPSLAGPKRPQDRIALSSMKTKWAQDLAETFGKTGEAAVKKIDVRNNGDSFGLGHGAVVIAAITSCTNTSNPSVMLASGLVAKKAVEKGLKSKPWTKTSLAPGSRVVTDYLEKAGLTEPLNQLGFNLVGYGCTTCIGNSGPLPESISQAIQQGDLVACSVLSGNRNFEGRINPDVKANYLASPPLVVAYALAGTTNIDLPNEPIGTGSDGKPVYLKDIWPTVAEVREVVQQCVTPEQFREQYKDVFAGDEEWKKIEVTGGDLYDWKETSTYIQNPPFFEELTPEPEPVQPIENARVLVMVGDSVTTDHISPAGSIKADSPAGRYLQEHGVTPLEFNSYGSRRGNDRVMTRGTFANIRLRNQMAPGTEGGMTTYLPTGKVMPIFDAAMKYRQSGTPLVVIAGTEYGTGSSRDWAAKGTMLLGVRAVMADSYERIHRSNLVGMGILPLQFKPGENRESLGIDGNESFTIQGLDDNLKPRQDIPVTAKRKDGSTFTFTTVSRIDTPVEIEYYKNGGILQTVLRRILKG